MAALLIVLIPGLASAAPPTSNDVWRVVSVANNQNHEVLNSFASAAVQATDVPTLDGLRASAHASLEDIYFSAEAQIKNFVAANPDLAADGEAALAQLLADHNGAHREVEDIYETVKDALVSPSTTTTTIPPTTTTTVPPTTTTTVPPTTTLPTTTTTVPKAEVTTTTTAAPTTTSTTTTTVVPTTTLPVDEGDANDGGAATSPGDGGPPTAQPDPDGTMSHIHAVGEGQLWNAPTAVEAGWLAKTAATSASKSFAIVCRLAKSVTFASPVRCRQCTP